jgi:hypothetical protein
MCSVMSVRKSGVSDGSGTCFSSASDYAETAATWKGLAREAGFYQADEPVTAPNPRHRVRYGCTRDFSTGGGLPSVRAGRFVFRHRDDWSEGAMEALALLGASGMHPPDNSLLCGQRAELAAVAPTASNLILVFAVPRRRADLAERVLTASLGAA